MKSLLFRDGDFEFVLKFEVADLDGLLAISVDSGELTTQDRDTIKLWYNSGATVVFINNTLVFEVCDHDYPRADC